MGFNEIQPYRPWFFKSAAVADEFLQEKDLLFGPGLSLRDAGAQFGGEVIDYEHDLSFITVHGAGHMVPTFRPRAALRMMQHVVSNDTFSPPVSDDKIISSYSDEDFLAYLDGWVEGAKHLVP